MIYRFCSICKVVACQGNCFKYMTLSPIFVKLVVWSVAIPFPLIFIVLFLISCDGYQGVSGRLENSLFYSNRVLLLIYMWFVRLTQSDSEHYWVRLNNYLCHMESFKYKARQGFVNDAYLINVFRRCQDMDSWNQFPLKSLLWLDLLALQRIDKFKGVLGSGLLWKVATYSNDYFFIELYFLGSLCPFTWG